MPLQVYTARLSFRWVNGYSGEDGINVTRGSGGDFGAVFAPSRPLLDEANQLKRAAGRSDEALDEVWRWYEPRYRAEMRRSYVDDRPTWETLLTEDEVTLLCYCKRPERCHRLILAEILVKLGATYKGER